MLVAIGGMEATVTDMEKSKSGQVEATAKTAHST